MRYMIEPIGNQFSNRDLERLAGLFEQRAAEGYEFHSVFQVSQPGCLGIGSPSFTYVAVFVNEPN